jgi:hypothetical protein
MDNYTKDIDILVEKDIEINGILKEMKLFLTFDRIMVGKTIGYS